MLNRKIIPAALAAGALSLVALLSACGTPALGATDTPPVAGPTESAAPLPDDTTSDAPSDAPSDDSASSDDEQTYKFGETTTYEDGLAVTIGKPVAFKPSEYAAKGDHDKHFVKMSVTIKNGTDKRYDPSDFYTTATTGERDAESVYDTENGVDGSPDTKVLKGHTVKFTIAYGVDKGQPLVLEVTPDYDHNSALFVS